MLPTEEGGCALLHNPSLPISRRPTPPVYGHGENIVLILCCCRIFLFSTLYMISQFAYVWHIILMRHLMQAKPLKMKSTIHRYTYARAAVVWKNISASLSERDHFTVPGELLFSFQFCCMNVMKAPVWANILSNRVFFNSLFWQLRRQKCSTLKNMCIGKIAFFVACHFMYRYEATHDMKRLLNGG